MSEDNITEITTKLNEVKVKDEKPKEFEKLRFSPQELVGEVIKHDGPRGVTLLNLPDMIPSLVERICEELKKRNIPEKDKSTTQKVGHFDCFISYRVLTDSPMARLLHGLLCFRFNTFLDKMVLEQGALWQNTIVEGLEDCSVFLPIMSNSGLMQNIHLSGNDNVLSEYQTAISSKKIIIPIYLNDFNPMVVSFLRNTVEVIPQEPECKVEVTDTQCIRLENYSSYHCCLLCSDEKVINLDEPFFTSKACKIILPPNANGHLKPTWEGNYYVTIFWNKSHRPDKYGFLLLNKQTDLNSVYTVNDNLSFSPRIFFLSNQLFNQIPLYEAPPTSPSNTRNLGAASTKYSAPPQRASFRDLLDEICKIQGFTNITTTNISEKISEIIKCIDQAQKDFDEKDKESLSVAETFDCYLSYQMQFDLPIARMIRGLLRYRYKTFFKSDCQEGANLNTLITAINSSSVFLPIISTDGLTQSVWANDELMVEYETAFNLASKKKSIIIIPLIVDGFSFDIIRSLPSNNRTSSREPLTRRDGSFPTKILLENRSNWMVYMVCSETPILSLDISQMQNIFPGTFPMQDREYFVENAELVEIASGQIGEITPSVQSPYVTIFYLKQVPSVFFHPVNFYTFRTSVIQLNKFSAVGTIFTVYNSHLNEELFTLSENFKNRFPLPLQQRQSKAMEYVTTIKSAISNTNANHNPREEKLGDSPKRLAEVLKIDDQAFFNACKSSQKNKTSDLKSFIDNSPDTKLKDIVKQLF